MPPTSEGLVWCSQSRPASWGHACARHPRSTASSVHLAYSGGAFYKTTGSPLPEKRAGEGEISHLIKQASASQLCSVLSSVSAAGEKMINKHFAGD